MADIHPRLKDPHELQSDLTLVQVALVLAVQYNMVDVALPPEILHKILMSVCDMKTLACLVLTNRNMHQANKGMLEHVEGQTTAANTLR